MMGVLGTVIDILPVSSVTSKSVNYSRYYRLTIRSLAENEEYDDSKRGVYWEEEERSNIGLHQLKC